MQIAGRPAVGEPKPQACLHPGNTGVFLLFYEPKEGGRGGKVPIVLMESGRHREVKMPS